MRSIRHLAGLLALSVVASQAGVAHAGGCLRDGGSGGPLGIDRCDEFEAKGMFTRRNQRRVDALVIGGSVAVALLEGTDSSIGRTAWRAVDSMAMAAVATEIAKHTFQRARPAQAANPDKWRQGRGYYSFPSGETAMMTAFITPIILEHRGDVPAVWGLVALPVYMAKARMASNGHWLSDVLAGAAVGAVSGYLASEREFPLVLRWTGGGAFVGLRYRF
ncbi:MAG: phosphatase PAP2 family protein [Burkholderiaceae bacterium]